MNSSDLEPPSCSTCVYWRELDGSTGQCFLPLDWWNDKSQDEQYSLSCPDSIDAPLTERNHHCAAYDLDPGIDTGGGSWFEAIELGPTGPRRVRFYQDPDDGYRLKKDYPDHPELNQ